MNGIHKWDIYKEAVEKGKIKVDWYASRMPRPKQWAEEQGWYPPRFGVKKFIIQKATQTEESFLIFHTTFDLYFKD